MKSLGKILSLKPVGVQAIKAIKLHLDTCSILKNSPCERQDSILSEFKHYDMDSYTLDLYLSDNNVLMLKNRIAKIGEDGFKDEYEVFNIKHLSSFCKKCQKRILANIKPICIEVGEWYYKGCFIQKQCRGYQYPFIVWKDLKAKSHILRGAFSMKEAIEIANENQVKNPDNGFRQFIY